MFTTSTPEQVMKISFKDQKLSRMFFKGLELGALIGGLAYIVSMFI